MKKQLKLLGMLTLAFWLLFSHSHPVHAETISEKSNSNELEIASVYQDDRYQIVPYERGSSYKGGQPRKGKVTLNRRQWNCVLTTYFETAKLAISPLTLPWSVWAIMKSCHNV